MIRRSLTTQLTVPTLVVALVGIGILVTYAGANARERVVEQIVDDAVERLDEYRELRNYYTEAVVEPARRAGLRVDATHAADPDVIPLPATLIHEIGERLRRRDDGLRLRLYSSHPFPGRRDRSLDDFAQSALARFENDPVGVFDRTSELDGRRFVRVAMPDRMDTAACVQCHNAHPDSPRREWEVGDVRGVLEVAVSAEEELAGVETLQRALLLGGGLLGASLLLVVGLESRRIGRRLDETVGMLDRVAAGDLAVSFPAPEPDELGAMQKALSRAIGNLRHSMESLHRQKRLVDAVPTSLIVCDGEHRVETLNPAGRDALERLAPVLGLDGSDVEGRPIDFLFEDAEATHRALGDDAALPHREVLCFGDESLDVTFDAIHGLDGARNGSLVSFTITTEDQRVAERLREVTESERVAVAQLRQAIERERERAATDVEAASETRQKADRISSVVLAAASGDLTRRVGLDGDSPMDRIAIQLDLFLDDLSARITQVRDLSDRLADAGHQLGKIRQHLASGARRTADGIDDVVRAWTATSEGVDGIASRIEQLAGSFQNVAEDALSASRVVGAGAGAARAARRSMGDLDDSTEEIRLVVTVIDQIADQSKLLALNASIEAARAGDRGRGFSVVAQEVRKLASQTEDATRQIAQTLAQMLERGGRSADSVRAMGDVMDRVETTQGVINQTMREQQSATDEMKALTEQVAQRSRLIAGSIEQLSAVAECAEEDAAETDREAHRILEIASGIGEVTSRFVC